MSQEIRFTNTIQITKTDATTGIRMVQYAPQPTFFVADLAGNSGPYGGTFTALLTYTKIDLNAFQILGGGMCRIYNQDPTHVVYVGLYVQEINRFASLMMILPGEFYPFRLSDHLGISQVPGTGTGSSGDTNPDYLALKASTAPCQVLVEIFPP